MQAYYKVWLLAKAPGPWPCDRCGQPVPNLGGRPLRATDGIIHHHDRNRANNAITNLRVMHHACHVAEHHTVTHWQLAALLRDQIRAGEMPRWMPSLDQLATEHGAARPTVRAAIRMLKDEGLVIVMPGRGTFVA